MKLRTLHEGREVVPIDWGPVGVGRDNKLWRLFKTSNLKDIRVGEMGWYDPNENVLYTYDGQLSVIPYDLLPQIYVGQAPEGPEEVEDDFDVFDIDRFGKVAKDPEDLLQDVVADGWVEFRYRGTAWDIIYGKEEPARVLAGNWPNNDHLVLDIVGDQCVHGRPHDFAKLGLAALIARGTDEA